jgi:hypothetical protein
MNSDKPPPTSPPEWIAFVVIIVLLVLAFLFIYFYIKPQLFQASAYVPPSAPSSTVICPTSPAPTGLTAMEVDFAVPSFDASWNAVLTPTTTGATILGYNIYVSTSPGITTTNTTKTGFTPIPQVRVEHCNGEDLVYGTTYYYRVDTVDTCGEGTLSTEEASITIVA